MTSDQIWAFFWVKIVIAVVIGFVLIVTICQIESAYEAYQMSEKGYIQSTIPGKVGVYWVKPKEKCNE